jgi:hypothetical protein
MAKKPIDKKKLLEDSQGKFEKAFDKNHNKVITDIHKKYKRELTLEEIQLLDFYRSALMRILKKQNFK